MHNNERLSVGRTWRVLLILADFFRFLWFGRVEGTSFGGNSPIEFLTSAIGGALGPPLRPGTRSLSSVSGTGGVLSIRVRTPPHDATADACGFSYVYACVYLTFQFIPVQ